MSEPATTKPKLTTTLRGIEHAVVLPRRHAERRELASTWANANLRGAAAILAYTVPGLELLRSPTNLNGFSPQTYKFDWYEFGADVLERLLADGHDEDDVLKASVPIFNAIAVMLSPSQAEMDEARDF